MEHQIPDWHGVDLVAGLHAGHACIPRQEADRAATTRPQRIYLAGPMSGLPNLNYPAFMTEAALLRFVGHHVENPAENAAPKCGTWLGYMRLAIAQLVTCDRIHLLPGWTGSQGANVEYTLAKGLGLMITLAEGAESARRHSDLAFLRSGGRLTGQTYATRMGALAMLATAIDRCQEIADGQETLRVKKLDANGKSTEESVCHGNKWLGATHCVEALRVLQKGTA